MNEEQVLRNLNKLNKDREELLRLLQEKAGEKEDTEEYIRNMEYQIRDKEKKLNSIIEELTRKSNLNEDQLLFLKN